MIGRFEHIVHQAQLLCQIDPVVVHFHADQLICAYCLCEHQSGKTDRTKAGYQDGIVSSSVFFFLPEMSLEQAEKLIDYAEKNWSDIKGTL